MSGKLNAPVVMATCCLSECVQFPPQIVKISPTISVSPGQDAVLTCRAAAYPTPKVKWMHTAPMGQNARLDRQRQLAGVGSGHPGSVGLAGPQVAGSGAIGGGGTQLTEPKDLEATLRLSEISQSANYTCVAFNELGVVNRDVEVVVKRELPSKRANLAG
ncbi:unnamed protein product [Protopolystoma xenopodis]|uniref:Ig-like domain-containing protein n=1 Tax=Protopolystoma xenopodis TaxID=117903 RepID=A0A3S5AB39_9PLAT|nr:unnamed protein product [Protopolystoma xenopodis]